MASSHVLLCRNLPRIFHAKMRPRSFSSASSCRKAWGVFFQTDMTVQNMGGSLVSSYLSRDNT